MPGGELLAAAAAGLSVVGILELKRRIGSEWLATHSLPAPYSGPKDPGGGPASTPTGPAAVAQAIAARGRRSRGLDLNRRTRCCGVPEAQRATNAVCQSSPCRTTPHWGVDISGDVGTPIYAAKAGTVVEARQRNGYGNQIQISHADGRQSTLYAHLSRMLVSEGQTVTAGQQIGEMGATIIPPVPMGPHLHFEVHNSQRPNLAASRLDPEAWLRTQGIGLTGATGGPILAQADMPDTDNDTLTPAQREAAALADFSMPAPVVGIGVALAVGALLLTAYQFLAPKREYRPY